MKELTPRATKRAYLTDINGDNVVNFQFAPASLTFSEGNTFHERLKTGAYYAEYTWISGVRRAFTLEMFIDRTLQSFSGPEFNQDIASEVRRIPAIFPQFTAFQSSAYVNAIRRAKGRRAEVPTVPMTSHSKSPEFAQNNLNEEKGVYPDLHKLLYYIRPSVLTQSTGFFENTGTIEFDSNANNRFTPPPRCRFFQGNQWKEGFISQVEYELSAMNRELVPRRLIANFTFLVEREGILVDLGDAYDFVGDVDRSTLLT
jgi:hypothetical protein